MLLQKGEYKAEKKQSRTVIQWVVKSVFGRRILARLWVSIGSMVMWPRVDIKVE